VADHGDACRPVEHRAFGQRDARHLGLHLARPALVVVGEIAQRAKPHPADGLGGQRGAQHHLPLVHKKRILDAARLARGADQHDDLGGHLQGFEDHAQMRVVDRLEPADENGMVVQTW
jgi:hypothetical protein